MDSHLAEQFQQLILRQINTILLIAVFINYKNDAVQDSFTM